MDQVMHPPPDVGATIYRYGHVSVGPGRVALDWVKHTVRAVVDRRLVVRHWTIKRGWIYEVWSEIQFSCYVETGVVVVADEKPRTEKS